MSLKGRRRRRENSDGTRKDSQLERRRTAAPGEDLRRAAVPASLSGLAGAERRSEEAPPTAQGDRPNQDRGARARAGYSRRGRRYRYGSEIRKRSPLNDGDNRHSTGAGDDWRAAQREGWQRGFDQDAEDHC